MPYHLTSLLLFLLGLLGQVSSNPQTPLLHHATGGNVSVALFAELEELARIVDIAYCVGSTGWGISKPFKCLSRCKDFPDFDLVTTWNTGPLLSDSCGFVALDHGKRRIIVAFRGTYSITNTIVDLSTVPQKYIPYPGEDDGDDGERTTKQARCVNCTVHWGFQSSWRNTRNAILQDLLQQVFLHPDYEVNLVGHSLGGAVAALAALDFQARGWNPRVTTFGEPRVGNVGLAKYIDDRFGLTRLLPENDLALRYRRLTHTNDPVPLLPLTEWGFAMHAGEIYISKPDLSPDIEDLQHCSGDQDHSCIAGQDSTTSQADWAQLETREDAEVRKRHLLASVQDEIYDITTEPWGIPSRYKLWQLFFAHRDYFWRIGLCVPGGDPWGGGGGKYADAKEDL